MNKFPQLETERLFLTQLYLDDVDKIVEYSSNEKITSNTQNIPNPYTRKDAISWINATANGFKEKRQCTFAIRVKQSKDFIGGIGLQIESKDKRAELGYWIAEPFWNRGFAVEATNAVLKFGFSDLGLQKIFATHLEKNPASGRVMIKNGMLREGIFKDHIYKDGIFQTLMQYRLTKEEFFKRVKKEN